MNNRYIHLKPNDSVVKCPECGNSTAFWIWSNQVCEDGCEIWVVCKCGYDPTANKSKYRLESVMGGCYDENCLDAIHNVWNEQLNFK